MSLNAVRVPPGTHGVLSATATIAARVERVQGLAERLTDVHTPAGTSRIDDIKRAVDAVFRRPFDRISVNSRKR